MDVSAITGLISNVGFPIVAYGAMFYYMVKQDKDHKEEMSKMSEALSSNTIAIQKLTDIIAEKEER